jgi:hypothetical protein
MHSASGDASGDAQCLARALRPELYCIYKAIERLESARSCGSCPAGKRRKHLEKFLRNDGHTHRRKAQALPRPVPSDYSSCL